MIWKRIAEIVGYFLRIVFVENCYFVCVFWEYVLKIQRKRESSKLRNCDVEEKNYRETRTFSGTKKTNNYENQKGFFVILPVERDNLVEPLQFEMMQSSLCQLFFREYAMYISNIRRFVSNGFVETTFPSLFLSFLILVSITHSRWSHNIV